MLNVCIICDSMREKGTFWCKGSVHLAFLIFSKVFEKVCICFISNIIYNDNVAYSKLKRESIQFWSNIILCIRYQV